MYYTQPGDTGRLRQVRAGQGRSVRPLPQLPLTTDAQGYLVAKSDFTEPVGPSFWERG